MPMFEYTARAPSGQIQKGQLDVASKDEVSAYLRTADVRNATGIKVLVWGAGGYRDSRV